MEMLEEIQKQVHGTITHRATLLAYINFAALKSSWIKELMFKPGRPTTFCRG